jgi:hypothetical protein
MMAMRLIAFGVSILLAMAQASRGADPTPGNLLRHTPLIQFAVVGGRITAPHLARAASRSFPGDNGDIKESLTINPSSDEPSISYRFAAPGREFTLEYRWPHSLTLIDRSSAESLRFVQDGTHPLRLVVETDGEATQDLQAKSLWQLLVFHPEAGAKLVMRLECLRSGWQLERQAAEINQAVRSSVRTDWLANRARWNRCALELGSSDFQLRQAADQRLRTGGIAAAAFLQTIDSSRLDPEQARRIAKIIEAASQEIDAPADVVATWMYDADIWCSLLRDDSLECRTKAADHLTELLERPLQFDPAAEPPVRTSQVRAIEDMLRR